MSESPIEHDTDPAREVVEIIEHVDPAELVIGANVRTNARADRALIASIRTHGVIEAVSAYREPGGTLVVLRGQRRTLAAREAGVHTVPVRVVPVPDDAARIVGQVIENERRETMTRADVAQAFAKLADLGLSPTRIAQQTGTRSSEVKAGLVVSGSQRARDVLASTTLTLEQPAALAEVEDDPEAVEELTQSALHDPERFAHLLQRVRDSREARAAAIARIEELRAAGWRIVDKDEDEDADETAEAGEGRDWVSCSAVWASDEDGRRVNIDAAALSPADDLAVRVSEYSSYGGGTWRSTLHVHHVVDREALSPRWWRTYSPGIGQGRTSLTTDEQTKTAEGERIERARVREGNAAWRAACTVRGQWITSHLVGRKTPVAGSEALLAWAIITKPYALTRAQDAIHPMLCEAMGVDGEAGTRSASLLTRSQASTPRAAVATASLAIVLAWQERSAAAQSWRQPSGDDRRILLFLQRAGYALADIEATVIQEPDAAPDEAPQE